MNFRLPPVLGGSTLVAGTAIGAGIAAVILDSKPEGDSSDTAEESQEAIASQDDATASEQSV